VEEADVGRKHIIFVPMEGLIKEEEGINYAGMSRDWHQNVCAILDATLTRLVLLLQHPGCGRQKSKEPRERTYLGPKCISREEDYI
jgi:hypothetical protein